MRITYERARVTGIQEDGKTVTEDVTCLLQQDPMLLAVRRNHALAGCSTIKVETLERFTRYIDEFPYRSRADIPNMGGQAEFDL